MSAEADEPDRSPDGRHPRETFDLVGHAAAEAELVRAMGDARMHHAWLFVGPKGVGKATLAWRFARKLLGARGAGLSTDPEDPVARMVATLAHPDLMVIRRPFDPKASKWRSEITVEEARKLEGFFALRPSLGGWRVAIVDAADDLNPNAANALLKTLEEPPERAVILLIAHAPGAVLGTIRSRCRRLALRALSPEETARASPAAGPEAVALSGGSPGRAAALASLDAGASYRAVAGLLERAPRMPADAKASLADKAARSETASDLIGDLVEDWLARAARAATGGDVREVLDGESAAMARLAGGRPERLVAAWEAARDARRATDGLNLDRGAGMLAMLRAIEDAIAGKQRQEFPVG
jgi:DNA polymerase III subunit delta'